MIFEKIRERLEDAKDSVPVNRLLDDIIKDKPKELGQLMAYDDAIDIINQVEAEYKDVLSMYYHSDFERRTNEVIPMLKTLHLLGTISLIRDLKAENDILRSYLPQPPKGE